MLKSPDAELATDALEQKARWLRRQTLEMIATGGKGHIGGSFSCMDILTTLYYGGILAHHPGEPRWEERDRLILSKGHGVLGIYPLLADRGFFSLADVPGFTSEGSRLGGHPDHNIPGIEVISGSLGHGLSVGAGIALGGKRHGARFRTAVLLGDGECHEGSVWEAAMFAAHYRLDNLVAIVDSNGICATGFLDQCLRLEPLDEKWRAFDWDVETVDGHAFPELLTTLRRAWSRTDGKPLVIIARTVKGRGVSFMENNPGWHHAVPKGEHLAKARQELA